MRESEFVRGALVTSPYADVRHYVRGGTQPQPHAIGAVGEVDSAGWATVHYADGYSPYLNCERCNLWRNVPPYNAAEIAALNAAGLHSLYGRTVPGEIVRGIPADDTHNGRN